MKVSRLSFSFIAGLLITSSPARCEVCQCGQKKEEPLLVTRVVGGGEALRNEFPWAAHIVIRTDGRDTRCGGSLINDRVVITAAHCVQDNILTINVTLGEHNIKLKEGFEFRTRVKEFGYDVHNSYRYQPKEGTVEYDIALLELEKPVNFQEYKHIRPICLPSERRINYTARTEIAIVTGWGATAVNYFVNEKTGLTTGNYKKSSTSNVLKKLDDVKILGHEECDAILIEYEESSKGRNKAKLRMSNVCGQSESGDSCVG